MGAREGVKMQTYTHPKGKGSGKYNGMALASDWKGMRVRATHDFRNGAGQGVTPGMEGVVTGVYAGLDVTFDVCKHCGTVTYVSKVSYSLVELIEG